MSKCFNAACGYETPKALETCPRCDGPLTTVRDALQIVVVPVPTAEGEAGE